MRVTWLLLFVGCAHPAPPPPVAPSPRAMAPIRRAPPAVGVKRPDLHCTLTTPDLEATCAAQPAEKRCRVGPPYVCHGPVPPPELQEAERLDYVESTRACECVCMAQVRKCS